MITFTRRSVVENNKKKQKNKAEQKCASYRIYEQLVLQFSEQYISIHGKLLTFAVA